MEALDWVVLAAYAGLVLAIGWFTGRGHQTTEELFLGGRRIPAWAAFLSMIATELSAATYIAVPAAAFGGTWAYIQYAFGALLGKWVLARWFITRYHRMGLVTVYGFLEARFGRGAELCSAWFFLVGRIIASGSRLFIAALAFQLVVGMPMEASIVVAGVIAGIYTLLGGIRAVIWTDTLQGAVFLIGAGFTLFLIIDGVEGGLGSIWEAASEQGKTDVFGFPDATNWSAFVSNYLASGGAFLVALFGGFFLTLATHGTDQDMVQRLLTTRDGRRGGRALLASGFTNFPITALFLLLGTALWFYFRPDLESFMAYDISDSKRIFPIFVLNEMPVGLRGLVFAGLFAAAMSSMDSALNSLATTWVVDIRRDVKDAAQRVRITRRATIGFGTLLVGAALLCIPWYEAMQAKATGFSLIDFALGSMTIVYGGLLGAFLVALVTPRRGTGRTVVAGMVTSAVCGFALALQPVYLDAVVVAWPWWIIVGTVVSFAIGVSRPASESWA